MAQLTQTQMEALAAMDCWREGMWLSTAQLNSDGVGLATLRSLHAAEMIDAQVTRTGKYWMLLQRGRLAIKDRKP